MTLPIKTRLAKRKLEIKEVRKEKQTVTSKKHDKNCFNEKNVEVLDDTDTNLLKELNNALVEEVKANEKAMDILKKKENRREIFPFHCGCGGRLLSYYTLHSCKEKLL